MTHSETQVELKACECGNRHLCAFTVSDWLSEKVAIVCSHCGATGQAAHDIDEANRLWNTRTPMKGTNYDT